MAESTELDHEEIMELAHKVGEVIGTMSPLPHGSTVMNALIVVAADLLDTSFMLKDLERARGILVRNNSCILSILSKRGWE